MVKDRESFSLSGTEMEDDDVISHVPDATENTCKSVRSKKKLNERCKNPAINGAFCGLHHKNPILWVPNSPSNKFCLRAVKSLDSVVKIQKWYRAVRPMFLIRRHGIGYWNRSILTNDSDFFSTEPIADISGHMFISYKDEQNHVYGFDIRSLNSLYAHSEQVEDAPQNPFTRLDLPAWLEPKKNKIVAMLKKRNISVEWIPIQPPTPEQQWRMKVVDLFHKIDELNYYSSPDWFIGLNAYGQSKFYRELFDIWNFRAGLSNIQKNSIVPQYHQKIFKHSPFTISIQPITSIQKINMSTIRHLITSAEDRNDRILGAMYVVTAFTVVNRQARIAYPWLYDSIAFQEPIIPLVPPPSNDGEQPQPNPLDNILGINWLQGLFFEPMPPLNLNTPPFPDPEQ